MSLSVERSLTLERDLGRLTLRSRNPLKPTEHRRARGPGGPRPSSFAYRALPALSRTEADTPWCRLSNRSPAGALGTLRICLERLGEWGGEDAPTGCTCRSASCAPTATSLCIRSSRNCSMIGSRNGRAASESRRLFTEHGRRIGPESVRKAVLQVAQEAGLGKVTAHQLRHSSPPRRSTGACRSRRSPRCSDTSQCG